MTEKTLLEIFFAHDSKVSDKWDSYLSLYDSMFAPFRNKNIRLLEIGVQNGGSLEIWAKYFDQAEAIVGCDVAEKVGMLKFDDPRIRAVVSDATQPAMLDATGANQVPFDIIIDDGSHLSSHIIKSFVLLFPKLSENGIYVVEDVHCSYYPDYEGGLFESATAMAFFKRVADVINFEHWDVDRSVGDVLSEILSVYGCDDVDLSFLETVHSIRFQNSTVIIEKAPKASNRIGRQVVKGEVEFVVDGRLALNASDYQRQEFVLSGGEARTRQKSSDELLPELETAYKQNRARIGELENSIALKTQEIDAIYSSTSWKLTAPVRLASRGIKYALRRRPFVGQLPKLSTPDVDAPVVDVPRPWRQRILNKSVGIYDKHLRDVEIVRRLARAAIKRGWVPQSDVIVARHALDVVADDTAEEVNGSAAVAEDAAPQTLQHISTGVPGYHWSPPLNLAVDPKLDADPRINVLLPSLLLKHMSGGPNTAVMLAGMLAERGLNIRFLACDCSSEGKENEMFSHMEWLLKRPVDQERFALVDAFDRSKPTFIGANDIFFATAWWTAQMARYAIPLTNHKKFIYLIQDFEPILHDASTLQARALETYDLPHIPIINTRLLLDHLVREQVGCYEDAEFANSALCFEPALDRNYYFPQPVSEKPADKKVLLFYARPSTAKRNLFEIGLVALRELVASGAIDNEGWDVFAMGERLDPIDLGKGMFLKPLPWLSFADYAERVRTADLLLSLMLSPHPSYPPLEMAASGKFVVTNSFSVKSAERLGDISPNILVAKPTTKSVSETLAKAVERINGGFSGYDPEGSLSLPRNWEESLSEVVSGLVDQVGDLQAQPAVSSHQKAISPGTQSARTNYEVFRRKSLARRRKQVASNKQVPGLLSFVTSAYNTKPSYLHELAISVLSQDGGTDFEWVILDNGSTEVETREALEQIARHPSVRFERVEENLGIIGGMRHVLSVATGQYIMPLDSDDVLEPDCVHVITRHILDNDYPAFLYTDEDKLSDHGFLDPYFKPDWDPVLFVNSCYVAHLCVIDREKALELSLYSESYAEGCHDWDSCLKFMAAGYVPHHIPEVLYSWRIHQSSTSGNIFSKSYIETSHRGTLQRYLDTTGVANIDIELSPYFDFKVDWWMRRRRTDPQSVQSILVSQKQQVGSLKNVGSDLQVVEPAQGLQGLAAAVGKSDSDLVHIIWDGVVPDSDEWRWDAMALFELFDDAVAVGGSLHDGSHIIDGPRVFGFGETGFDCPDRGRAISDAGYFAWMHKNRSVSAISSGHFVVHRAFLNECLSELEKQEATLELIGPWLSAIASKAGKRVVYSAHMRAKAERRPDDATSEEARQNFLSYAWDSCPDVRYYSASFGLSKGSAYRVASEAEREAHVSHCQNKVLPYHRWLEKHLEARRDEFPLPPQHAKITLLTTVYENTRLDLLGELADTLLAQTARAEEWVIVAHGPISEENLKHLKQKSDSEWGASLIVVPDKLGIAGAMSVALDAATGDYVVPLDADDLLTPDAIQIIKSSIAATDSPDMLFSDEDILVDGVAQSPYLRSDFDPVLNLDSSYIWHLCAIKRQSALDCKLYSDGKSTWCHDWDSAIRIATSGGRIEHMGEVLYHWRQHHGSTTNSSQVGDGRSLQSVRHVLEQHIERQKVPAHFEVAEWPVNRGAPELYIARKPFDLPQFIWIDDAIQTPEATYDDDAILVVVRRGVVIDSREVFPEVARLFELHENCGAVGGLVADKDGKIRDACYVGTGGYDLVSPWMKRRVDWGGPFAMAQKCQSVETTGHALAFFKISSLVKNGLWNEVISEGADKRTIGLCRQLRQHGSIVSFSPLVLGKSTSSFAPSEATLHFDVVTKSVGALSRACSKQPYQTTKG